MRVLVLNAGSSTLKFQLIDTGEAAIATSTETKLARGQFERIGGEAVISLESKGEVTRTTAALRNHAAAVEYIVAWLADEGITAPDAPPCDAVGHRVVHGGELFSHSVQIDDKVIAELEDLIDLAPLHNPHNIAGIKASHLVLGRDIPNVAVFDTAFHHTLPERAHIYAIPYQLYRRYRVRRYGFHGTSHRYVAYRYRQLTGRTREDTKVITLHLGNGASACAIDMGHSIDTSMGFTPLEGLVMGSRSGDLDPAIVDFVAEKEGLSTHGVETMLNKQSGLLGISGLTADMRELLAEEAEHDDRRAKLAIDIFCYRARKYIGSYLAAMNGADAIVFTGGIGENSADIRARILDEMEWLGIEIDESRNAAVTGGSEGRIDRDQSRVEVWVLPTDEELLIARDTWRLITGVALPF
jgi:acetate kinase